MATWLFPRREAAANMPRQQTAGRPRAHNERDLESGGHFRCLSWSLRLVTWMPVVVGLRNSTAAACGSRGQRPASPEGSTHLCPHRLSISSPAPMAPPSLSWVGLDGATVIVTASVDSPTGPRPSEDRRRYSRSPAFVGSSWGGASTSGEKLSTRGSSQPASSRRHRPTAPLPRSRKSVRSVDHWFRGGATKHRVQQAGGTPTPPFSGRAQAPRARGRRDAYPPLRCTEAVHSPRYLVSNAGATRLRVRKAGAMPPRSCRERTRATSFR